MSQAAFLFFICSLLVCTSASKDRKAELLKRQQASKNGLVHLTPSLFDELASGKSRPYSLIIMMKADRLVDKSSLKLAEVLEEFALTSQAYDQKYKSGSKAGKVFFATLEYDESGHIFERMGVKSLPLIVRIPEHLNVKMTGDISIKMDDRMTPQTYPQYPWSAETIAEFVHARTGLSVEKISRSSIMDSSALLASMAVVLGAFSYMGYTTVKDSLVNSHWIYITLSMAVCWFATSGGLFNIIRGVPFMTRHTDGSFMLFYPGATQQFGAEGFIMGSGYILFSVVFLLSTHVVPTIKSAMARRISFYTLAAISFICLKQIMKTYYLKTGYHLQQYIL